MILLIKALLVLASIAAMLAMGVKLVRRTQGGEITGVLPRWKGLIPGIIIFLLTIVLVRGLGTVPAGHRGIVLKFSAVTNKVLNEGIYVINPITETVELMSVRIEAYEADASSASRDLQEVHTKVTVNCSVNPPSSGAVYQTLGHEWKQRVLKPAVQEAVKASTAKYDAEQLITERPRVKDAIEAYLKDHLINYGISMSAVSITDFSFSGDFMKSIEDKVRAKQKAMQAENELREWEANAKKKVAAAKGEAESNRVLAQSITQQLMDWRRLDIAEKTITKWDGKRPMVEGQGSGLLLQIPTPNQK
jgi:regulator of protease activity HflC (stomatin/prohibitin superfamily)